MNIMMQCGAKAIKRNDLFALETPKALTKTHYPIAHKSLILELEASFKRLSNYEISNEEYGISHNNNRMFSIMSVKSGNNENEWETIVGLRNSHDKAFSAGLSVGSKVFVCDNLAFSHFTSFHDVL